MLPFRSQFARKVSTACHSLTHASLISAMLLVWPLCLGMKKSSAAENGSGLAAETPGEPVRAQTALRRMFRKPVADQPRSNVQDECAGEGEWSGRLESTHMRAHALHPQPPEALLLVQSRYSAPHQVSSCFTPVTMSAVNHNTHSCLPLQILTHCVISSSVGGLSLVFRSHMRHLSRQ